MTRSSSARGGSNSQGAPLSNEQAVVLAVARLGGHLRPINTEDVAVEVDRLAPERFRWRKYPDQINIELVHTALRDAKGKSGLLAGSGVAGWQLTQDGAELVRQFERRGGGTALARPRLDSREKMWASREKGRLLTEPAYQKWRDSGAESVSVREAERFFRLDDYVVGPIRQQRMQRLLAVFGNDPELGSAIRELAERMTKQ